MILQQKNLQLMVNSLGKHINLVWVALHDSTYLILPLERRFKNDSTFYVKTIEPVAACKIWAFMKLQFYCLLLTWLRFTKKQANKMKSWLKEQCLSEDEQSGSTIHIGTCTLEWEGNFSITLSKVQTHWLEKELAGNEGEMTTFVRDRALKCRLSQR